MYRLDTIGKIVNYRETVEGFLDIFCSFSKAGPLVYQRADGRLETEYLTEEELFNEDSLATATGKPVTYLHPPEWVTKDNVRKYARGSTGTKIVKDTPFATIVATVHDAELIDVIKSGRARQVSAGYTTNVVKGDDGKLYQSGRVYNHFSVVPQGRAGADVRVLYGDNGDSDNTQILRAATNGFHAAAMERHKMPLTLSKQSQTQGVPQIKKAPHEIGPFNHLRSKASKSI